MSAEWKWSTLGDETVIDIGRTPSRSDKSMWDPSRTSRSVWLSIADLSACSGRHISDSKEYISAKGAKAGKLVKAGTLLMSFKLSIGKLAFAGVDLYTNEAIAALPIRDRNRLNPEFLYHYLSSVDWAGVATGSEKVKGATLNKAKLAVIPVPVPPLDEQQRIVAKLDFLLPEITESLAVSDSADLKIEELFHAALTEAFTPTGQESVKAYSAVALLSLGKMLDRAKATGQHKTPYLRNVNVRWGEFDMSDISEMDIRPEEFDRVSVRRGDVVVCEGGEPGRCAVWREDGAMAIQKALHRMRPYEGMDSDYLALNLEYQVKRGDAKDLFTGTTIKHLTGEKLRVMKLPVPSLDAQRATVGVLSTVRAMCQEMQRLQDARRTALLDLRKSILEAAFRGDL